MDTLILEGTYGKLRTKQKLTPSNIPLLLGGTDVFQESCNYVNINTLLEGKKQS